MTKIHDVYLALIALTRDGVCEATQAKIAQAAGVSERGLRDIIKRLSDSRTIQVNKSPSHYGPASRHNYQIKKLPEENFRQSPKLPEENFRQSPKLPEENFRQFSGLSAENAQPPQKAGLMINNMIHEHDHTDMKEIKNILNFISEKNRTICAAHCDLDRARVARAFYEDCMGRESWHEYGIDPKRGIGYIVRLLKNGSPIPPPVRQTSLPGGAIDLTPALPTLPPPTGPEDLDLIWSQAEAQLQYQVTRQTFDAIISGARLYRENGHYVIAAQNEAAKEHMENRFNGQITRALANVIGSEVTIKFELLQEQSPNAPKGKH